MLKGRGKVFAPKKVPRKPQGASAPSSARPSVERSSQTPAPSQPPQDNVLSTPQKAVVPEQTEELVVPVIETFSQQDPSHKVQEQAVASVSQDGEVTVRPELKRKEREDDVAPPPAKRVPVVVEEANAAVPQNDTSPVIETSSTTEVEWPAEPVRKSAPTGRQRIIPPKLKKKQTDPNETFQSPGMPMSPIPQSQDGPSTETERASIPTEPASSQPTSIIPPSVLRASISTPATESTAVPNEPTQAPAESSVLAIVEKEAEGQRSRSASPAGDISPVPPRHRYPSPENIARLPEETRDGSSNMGRAGGGGIGIGSGIDNASALRPGEVGQASEIVPRGVLNPDGTSGDIVVEEPVSAAEGQAKPKRKYTKRKKVQPQGDDDDVRTTVEMQLNRPRRVAGAKRDRKKKKDGAPKKQKQRAETPEGASDEEIDQSTLTMTDLCKDLRIGKKFSMHSIIKARVQQRKLDNIALKMQRNNPELGDQIAQALNPNGEATAAGPSGTSIQDNEGEGDSVAPTGMGVKMRLIDGNIVMDESSLQIDRHARAREDAAEMEEVIENEFTRVITSGTYMKRERAQLWDHAGTARFYEGLAQFGTDFEMIAKLFPHRSRKQIKLKFNKEERVNPEKVTKAMIGSRRKHIDLKHFEKMADMQLEEIAAIHAERDAFDQDMMEKEKELKDAEEEITRQKKAAIQGASGGDKATANRILATVSDDEDDEPGSATGRDSAKENRGPRGGTAQVEGPKKRVKKAAKKNKHSHYAGGEKVTVLGTIER